MAASNPPPISREITFAPISHPQACSTFRTEAVSYPASPLAPQQQDMAENFSPNLSGTGTLAALDPAVPNSRVLSMAEISALLAARAIPDRPKSNRQKNKKKKLFVLDQHAMLIEADTKGAKPAPLTLDSNDEPIYDYLGSPHVALAQLSIRDIRVIDAFFGPSPDDELKGPFLLRICYHDTSQPEEEIPAGVKDYEEYAGEWSSLNYTNGVACAVAHERHREMFKTYYAGNAPTEGKYDEWIRDDGTQIIMARDRRFYIMVEVVTRPLPDHVADEDVVWFPWTAWPEFDVGAASIEVTGPVRTRVIPRNQPAIFTEHNMGRNLANKTAAMLFYTVFDGIILEKEMHQSLFEMAKISEEAWTSMLLETPEKDYTWTFEHAFKCRVKHPKEKGGDEMTKVKIKVEMLNVKPWADTIRGNTALATIEGKVEEEEEEEGDGEAASETDTED